MESLRVLLRKQYAKVTGVRSLYVVVEDFFPLAGLYVDSLEKGVRRAKPFGSGASLLRA